MYKYAQIDDNGKLIGVSFLSGEVISDKLIEVDEDFVLESLKYVNGVWVEIEEEEITIEEIVTQQDRIEANTDFIVMMMEG